MGRVQHTRAANLNSAWAGRTVRVADRTDVVVEVQQWPTAHRTVLWLRDSGPLDVHESTTVTTGDLGVLGGVA